MVSVYGGMTEERKACIWQLWRQGIPMSILARDIAKPPAAVYSYLLYIKPRIFLIYTWAAYPLNRRRAGVVPPRLGPELKAAVNGDKGS
jgi:hypothetical protein